VGGSKKSDSGGVQASPVPAMPVQGNQSGVARLRRSRTRVVGPDRLDGPYVGAVCRRRSSKRVRGLRGGSPLSMTAMERAFRQRDEKSVRPVSRGQRER